MGFLEQGFSSNKNNLSLKGSAAKLSDNPFYKKSTKRLKPPSYKEIKNWKNAKQSKEDKIRKWLYVSLFIILLGILIYYIRL